jgi:hypothetical protein
VECTLAILSALSDELIAAGTLAAAIVAGAGLFLTARSIRQQTNSVDVRTALSIFFAIRESERELQEAKDDEAKTRFRLVEHCNFLELLAQLHFSEALTKQSSNICKDLLLNHLAALDRDEAARKVLAGSVTSSETIEYMIRFCQTYKMELERRRDEISKALGQPLTPKPCEYP